MITRFLTKRSTALWIFLIGLTGLVAALKIQVLFAAGPAREQGSGRTFRAFITGEKAQEDTSPRDPSCPAWATPLDPRMARLEKGKLVQTLANGTRITLTLDPALQAEADRLLRQYAPPYASIVMIDVRTGRILALAGSSSAEPKLDPMTLALRAWAPAASVFKLVTAAALLSENRARPTTRECFHGGDRVLRAHHLIDDPEKDRQCDTLSGGLAKSINPIFGKLTRKHLDRTTLLKHANAFGFNQPLPFILPNAISPAAIPEELLARAQVATGFWHTNMSPLHGALIAQAIANRGKMTRPRLVAEASASDGQKLPLPEGWTRRVTTEYVARLLGRMMVMTTTVGTAREGFYDRSGRAYVPWARVAGKTGSLTRTEPYVDYNWFIGYAPARRPKIAFAVLLGNAARWRVKAFHLARFLLYTYLSRTLHGTQRPKHRLRSTRPPRPIQSR